MFLLLLIKLPRDLYQPGLEKSKVSELNPPYTPIINLQEIGKNGNFPCPKCGVTISPGDDVYTLIEARFKGDSLKYLLIQCECGNEIKLEGFLSDPIKITLIR